MINIVFKTYTAVYFTSELNGAYLNFRDAYLQEF